MKAILFVILSGAVMAAWACIPELSGGAQVIDSRQYVLAYRTQPGKIEIGQHFAVELALCAKDGAAPPSPGNVRVDAHMPEHRHGMNYRTTITGSGAGRYRAEGLMFHMPGRWEYLFEVRAAGTTERLSASVLVP